MTETEKKISIDLNIENLAELKTHEKIERYGKYVRP